MASSGSFSGSIVSGHYQLRVDWSQAQNVSANTSTITAKIYLVNDWSLNIYGRTSSITINGTSQNYSSDSISTTGTHLLGTVTQTVAHDSDGSKSIAMSCVFNIQATISGTYYSSISCSANVTLDTIPRASSVSMPTATMGSEVTISINPAVDQFTHTLTYSFGSASGTITTKTSLLAVKWTPALTLANQVPNATSGTGTLTCQTYSGSTLIGTKSITITLKVPTSVVPTIGSFTATRVDNDVPSSWGIYVQNKSAVTLTISNAAGARGSTIKSYSITGGTYSGSSSTLTTGVLVSSGSYTFTAKVTDSRGRTATKTVSISVVAYSPPSFTGYSSYRSNSSGTASDTGTYIRGLVNYTYASCSSKNSVTRATYYKRSTATSWTNASKSFNSGTAFTFGGGNISTEYTYDVKYTLTDAFTTISVTDTVSTAAVLMDFLSGGKGIAIGKVAETENCLEVSLLYQHLTRSVEHLTCCLQADTLDGIDDPLVDLIVELVEVDVIHLILLITVAHHTEHIDGVLCQHRGELDVHTVTADGETHLVGLQVYTCLMVLLIELDVRDLCWAQCTLYEQLGVG